MTVQAEKRQLEKELNEIREQMDIKERKIIVLQKKVRKWPFVAYTNKEVTY